MNIKVLRILTIQAKSFNKKPEFSKFNHVNGTYSKRYYILYDNRYLSVLGTLKLPKKYWSCNTIKSLLIDPIQIESINDGIIKTNYIRINNYGSSDCLFKYIFNYLIIYEYDLKERKEKLEHVFTIPKAYQTLIYRMVIFGGTS